MKFYCDACNTKYAISDDKVRGKVLKVRCKHCGNVITVREMQSTAPKQSQSPQKRPPPQPPTPPKPPPVDRVPQTNWHYAVNGVTYGPFVLGTLKAKYSTGEIGDETYVWHDSFDSWKPVATVSIFESALRQGAALKPRFKTMGFTGPVEAVRPSTGQLQAQQAQKAPGLQEGSVPQQRSVEPQVASPTPEQKRTPEAKPRNLLDQLKNKPGPQTKLDRLRRRLEEESEVNDTAEEPVSQQPASDAGFGASLGPAPTPASSAGANLFPISNPTEPGSELSELSFSAASNPVESQPVDDPGASDLIGDVLGGLLQDSDTASQPMFPTTPELGSERSANQQVSHSLLIQLDGIKKTGRKRRVFAGIGVLVLLGLIASAAVAMYVLREEKVETVAEKNPLEDRELNIVKYSKEAHKKFASLDLDETVLSGAVDADQLEKELEAMEFEEEVDEKPAKTAEKTEVVKPTKVKSVTKTETKKPVEKPVEKVKKTTNDILAPRAKINRPEDKLTTSKSDVGLSREDAQKGFRKISSAVEICRQRHAARSGTPLKAAKLKLTVNVSPSGKVTTFSMSPSSLKHTAFDRCMSSKKDTWRFAKFGGPPVKINRTFILQ